MPVHAYCQRIVAPGPIFCTRRSVGSDPCDPLMSLCRPHLPLHDSPFECDECGGPSPESSMHGCQYCDGQGDIVPRGQARIRTWRPTELN